MRNAQPLSHARGHWWPKGVLKDTQIHVIRARETPSPGPCLGTGTEPLPHADLAVKRRVQIMFEAELLSLKRYP